MSKIKRLALFSALSATVLVAGCGYSTGDRVVSGGLLGAGAGAGLSAITGGNLLTGTLLGGVGGAVLGGVTTPQQQPQSYQYRSQYDRQHYQSGY